LRTRPGRATGVYPGPVGFSRAGPVFAGRAADHAPSEPLDGTSEMGSRRCWATQRTGWPCYSGWFAVDCPAFQSDCPAVELEPVVIEFAEEGVVWPDTTQAVDLPAGVKCHTGRLIGADAGIGAIRRRHA